MLYIRSPEETYSVDDLNRIYRTQAGGFDYTMLPSDDWKLIGAIEYHVAWGVYRILRHFTVEQIRAGEVPWLYQNRKQRCYLIDKDHGTTRVWMSPTPYTLGS
jgi:hypothetical protein